MAPMAAVLEIAAALNPIVCIAKDLPKRPRYMVVATSKLANIRKKKPRVRPELKVFTPESICSACTMILSFNKTAPMGPNIRKIETISKRAEYPNLSAIGPIVKPPSIAPAGPIRPTMPKIRPLCDSSANKPVMMFMVVKLIPPKNQMEVDNPVNTATLFVLPNIQVNGIMITVLTSMVAFLRSNLSDNHPAMIVPAAKPT